MGGWGVDKHDQLLDREAWKKMFRHCRCKRRFRTSHGSADVQCWIIAFPYFGRCYWRKCPKIKSDWEMTKTRLLNSVDAPALRVNGYLKNPFTDGQPQPAAQQENTSSREENDG